jgi:RNA polymerase sigma-70 factor (ECF subfamily)
LPELAPQPPSASTGLDPAAERVLVDRARRGEQEALGQLYDAYLPRLYRYCLSRVGNETDAEDLAEEIFLKVLGAIDGFQWQPAGRPASEGAAPGEEGTDGDTDARVPFAAWLFRIAHNHVVSFHRRAATRGPVAELSEQLSDTLHDGARGPAELAETRLTIEEVFSAVRLLPDAQREVILLRFASGLSIAETAEILGKQLTNVKVLQHKGVQKLKLMLLGPGATGEPDPTAETNNQTINPLRELLEQPPVTRTR